MAKIGTKERLDINAGLSALRRRVTDLEESEKALGENEQNFRALAENANDGIFIAAGAKVFVYVNKRMSEMTGYSNAELVGASIKDLVHPGEFKKIAERYRKRLEGKPAPSQYETVIVRKDGRSLPVEVTGAKTIWQQQPADLVIMRDITERKQAEEALQQSEERYRTTLDGMLEGCQIIDSDWRYKYLNDAAVRHSHRPREQLLGHTMMEMYPGIEDTEMFTNLRDCMAKRIPHRMENLFTFPDGSQSWFELSIEPAPEGTFILSLDITERKRMEEELKQAIANLERSNAELEQFAYVASHDLQEPLRMVASYTQLLAQRYKGRLDADADEFIAYAVDGANRMQKLINDLLIYSRVSRRGKDFEPTDCEAVLDQVLDNLQAAIGQSSAAITCDPLPVVMADDSQLAQLFQNLIGNAIKFCGDTPPKIHVSARRDKGSWLFSVRDNGIGIDMQYADRIFVIFQRLHTRTEYPGTGIGLAICKKIVERHNGRIWVESQPGKGAIFYFTIPGKGDG